MSRHSAEAPATGTRPSTSGGRLPALDGLRALAVVAVMIYHSRLGTWVPGGFLGVDVFFVLSGYLITTLLVREHARGGHVDVRAFYTRRALRLFPALGVVLLVVAVASLVFRDQAWASPTLHGLPWVILYAANWKLAFGDPDSLGLLLHTWSLAVEEQFYLLAPALFLLVVGRFSRPALARAAAGLAVVVVLLRAVLLHAGADGFRVTNGLDTHSDGLLLGCALALWLATPGVPGRVAAQRFLAPAAWGALLVLAYSMLQWSPHVRSAAEYGYAVAGLATAVLVAALVTTPPRLLDFALTNGVAVWLGQRSYGLYLWHIPLYAFLPLTSVPTPLAVPLQLVVVLAVAAASYRFVEQPFLRLKNRRYEPGGRSTRRRITVPGVPRTGR